MIQKKYLEKNRTYTNPSGITAQYVVVHSTGCAKKSKEALWDNWNRSAANKSCHGMVDDQGSILTLPLGIRGWHVGPLGNGKSVGFEICEPENMAYVNLAHTKVDTARYDPASPAVREDFMKRYENAVELAAYMCRELGLPSQRVLCHREANARGMATNHADTLHWFPLFGKDMDTFRRDVAKRLGEAVPNEDKPSQPDARAYVARVTANRLNVRSGPGTEYPVVRSVKRGEAYTIVEEKSGWGKLKSGAGWVSMQYIKRIDRDG